MNTNCSYCDEELEDIDRVITVKTKKGLRLICDKCLLKIYPRLLKGEDDAEPGTTT